MKITSDAIARFASVSYTLPEKWTQLRFANEEACSAITRQAGFGTPLFKRLPIFWQTATALQLVTPFEKMSVRTKMILENQPPWVREQIHEYILSQVEALRADGVICISWPALLSVVRKSV
jgi:hypothetical protein